MLIGHDITAHIPPVVLRAMKNALAISYAVQQMAVLGMVVTILGFSPLKKPVQPSLRWMIRAASKSPFTFRNSASAAVPLVCSSVLITSSGVVMPAATPPAIPPAKQCVYGSYFPVGFSSLTEDS